MHIKAYLIWLLLGLLGLAACRSDIAFLTGGSEDITITYQRQGGIAGITQEWVIYPDGRMVGPGGQEMKVPPQQVTALLAAAAEVDSSSLQKSYVPDDACCDQFIYTIIIKVGDRETKVQTSDSAKHPEQVTSLLMSIEELIAQAVPIQ